MTISMKEFPKRLNISEKPNFSKIHLHRVMCYLRKELYEHIISSTDENDYFDLGTFSSKYFPGNRTVINTTLFEQMRTELSLLGWSCKSSYGGTGIFIYSSQNPPTLCYEDGL